MERSLATGWAYWPSALSKKSLTEPDDPAGQVRRTGVYMHPCHAGRGMSGHVAEMDENAQLSAGHSCGSRHYTTGCRSGLME